MHGLPEQAGNEKKNKKWSVAKGLHGEDATLQHCAERAYHALTFKRYVYNGKEQK